MQNRHTRNRNNNRVFSLCRNDLEFRCRKCQDVGLIGSSRSHFYNATTTTDWFVVVRNLVCCYPSHIPSHYIVLVNSANPSATSCILIDRLLSLTKAATTGSR